MIIGSIYIAVEAMSAAYAAPGAERSLVRSVDYFAWIRPYNQLLVKSNLANEVGVDGALSYVSDLASYWSYSSLHYYRLTDRGTFGGRINSARRFSTTAVQYQAEAYPVFSNGVYAAFNLAYANTSQTLFASYQYRAEGYFPLPYNYEYSLGQGGQFFPRFSDKRIYLFTGSIGKYIGDYFVWARPYYYTPQSNFLYEVGLRRTFVDPNQFVSVRLNTGHLPDIGDLPPLDNIITVSQTAIAVGGQLPLRNNFFVKADVSYAHQKYPADLVRNITTLYLSVFVRF